MKTITVRDLRQRWPQAEAMLAAEGELVITRDSKPVAKLVRFVGPRKSRRRFDPRKHAIWQTRVGGRRAVHWVREFLGRDRNSD
jgi:antitoxin (DNA-binding transcriptional repressor) of toxin-antitoxin stability system